MSRRSGLVLLAVLFILTAASLFALALVGEDRALQRRLDRVRENERQRLAVEYALALAEARVRARLRDPRAPRRGEFFRVGEDGQGSFVVDVPDPPAFVTESDVGPPLTVTGRVTPASEPGFVRTVARNAHDGRPVAVVRPIAHLLETTPAALARALEPYFEESPLASVAAATLTTRLIEIAREILPDSDALRTALKASLFALPPADPALRELLEAHREELLVALDPYPRLRRTYPHPARANGRDRGSYDSRGACLAPRLSGRVWLEARVEPPRGRPVRVARRRRELLRHVHLRTQVDWIEGSLDQPGGVTTRGVILGPEVIPDGAWILGEWVHHELPIADPQRWAWRPFPRGALGVRRRLAMRLELGSDGPHYELLPLPPDVLPQKPLTLSGSRRRWLFASELGLRIFEFAGETDDGELVPGVAPVSLVPWGLSALVIPRSRAARPMLPSGRWGAGFVLPPGGGTPVSLPGLAAVLFPITGGPDPGWVLVTETEGRRSLAGSPPPAAAELFVDDGAQGVWWIEKNDRETRVSHGEVSQGAVAWAAGPWMEGEVLALVPYRGRGVCATVSRERVRLWRRGALGPELAGMGAVPEFQDHVIPASAGAVLSLALPVRGGVWSAQWRATVEKRLDAASEVFLAPQVASGPALFRAPLRGSLEASIAGRPVSAHGTVNHLGSVLTGADLSDLVGDGVFLSPLRGETLRYATSEVGLGRGLLPSLEGNATLLVKPARSATESAEPERDRVVLVQRQEFTIAFDPDSTWISQNHPSRPSEGAIRSYRRRGARERRGRAISRIVRRVGEGVWVHERETKVFGPPWILEVSVGDPPEPLPVLVVDDVHPGGVVSSKVSVPDVGSAGVWQRLCWGWRSGGESWLAVGSTGGRWATTHAPSIATGAAFEIEDEHWSVEVGGDLGGKAYRGIVTDLRLDSAPVARTALLAPAFPRRLPAPPPHIRWVLPHRFPAGSRVRSLRALGEFPSGTTLRWRVEEWSDRGKRVVDADGVSVTSRLPTPLPVAVHWVVSLWLVPDAGRTSTPLIDGVDLEWIPPVSPTFGDANRQKAG